MKYKIKIRYTYVSEDELIRDLRAAAKKHGSPRISKAEYNKLGRYSGTTFTRRFGSWGAAINKAGLKPYVTNISAKELLENFENVWKRLGRQPVYIDLNKNSLYKGTPYQRCFGSWNKALLAFDEYIKSGRKSYPREKRKPPRKPQPIKPRKRRRTQRKPGYMLRYKVLKRDRFMCRLCGSSPADDKRVELHIDHIKPWSKGGETTFANLQTLCHRCNLGKGSS
jgi:hypothetical protein